MNFQELLAQIIILGLAVWRISHALTSQNGPFGAFEWLRERVGVHEEVVSGAGGFLVGAFSCTGCMVVALGGPAALLVRQGWLLFFISWLAISAVALIIEEVASPPPVLWEDEE